MLFGNLSDVLENEQTIYEAANNIMQTGYVKQEKKSKFSKILTALSKYGMNYSDDIQKNMQAIPADKLLQPKEDALLQQSLWGAGVNNWKVKPEEEKGFALFANIKTDIRLKRFSSGMFAKIKLDFLMVVGEP